MAVSSSENLKNVSVTSDFYEMQVQSAELIKFSALSENIKVAVLIFQNQQICYANRYSELLTGYTREELAIATDLLIQLQLEPTKQVELDKCALIQDRQVKILTKNGKQCWLNCSTQVGQFANQPAVFVTAVDITSYKEAEQKMKLVLEQEKKLVSMVSHELRSPLNIISFSSRLLSRYGDCPNPGKIKKHLERLQRGVETLNLLIDEWLILGKAKAGKLNFEPKKLDLEQFCRDLLGDLQLEDDSNQTLCDRSSQQINFLIQGDYSAVNVDRRILQLILTNLLENALKYSPDQRAIDFRVVCSPTQITFKIKDRGIGIDLEDLPQLFAPFHRGKNVGQISGHGLGLAIVNKLVKIHHGQITIDSTVGVGTEFKVTFPRLKAN
ncbi:MAG: PAS domain-containing sensor histidine kinase [Cyanobacteria bacterium P01_A01_bin.83]